MSLPSIVSKPNVEAPGLPVLSGWLATGFVSSEGVLIWFETSYKGNY